MKLKELKRKLRNESKTFVPDLKDHIFSTLNVQPKTETKRFNFNLKPALLFSFSFILLVVIGISMFSTNVSAMSNTFVSIDINPSIELELDENEKVVKVQPLNVDAVLLLEETEDLVGKDYSSAITNIIDLAKTMGFLDENDDNQKVMINAINNNQDIEDQINEKIENYFKNNSQVQVRNISPEVLKQAKANHISAGKMALAKEAMVANPSLNLEDAIKLNITDLNMKKRNITAKEISDFQQGYLQKINNLLNIKQEAEQQFVNNSNNLLSELNSILEMIRNNVDIQTVKETLVNFLNTNFADYQYGNLLTYSDVENICNDLIEYINSKKENGLCMMEDKLNTQLQSFRDKLREDLQQTGRANLDAFMFDNDFSMGQYQNGNNNSGLNMKEKVASQLIDRMNMLMSMAKNNNGMRRRVAAQIETIKSQYNEIMNSSEISDNFKNSEKVTNFENDYRQFHGGN